MTFLIPRRNLVALALSSVLPRPAGAQVPRRGGTLIMAVGGEVSGFNLDVTTAVNDYIAGSLIYEGLTELDQDFRPVPRLAKSWTVSPDGREYNFQLVEAVFSDGKPLTSDDVKFTLEQASAKYGSKFAAAAARISGVAIPDARTVTITLDKPYGPLLFSLSSYANAGILPAHIFRGTNILDNSATRSQPVGTGPFIVSEIVRGDHVSLARNPQYWQPEKPYLDEIIIKTIPDEAGRVLALKAGEVDFCHFYFFPTSHVVEAQADPKLQVREHGFPENRMLVLNNRRPALAQPRARQALMIATDRSFIRQSVFLGLGQVQKNAIDSRIPWAHDPAVDLSHDYPFDPLKAAAILDELGFKPDAGGHRFDLHFVYATTDPGSEQLGQLLAQMWGKIGVRLILEGGTQEFLVRRLYMDWDFDISPQSYTTGGDPAIGIARLYTTAAIRKAPYVNASGYSNNEVDALFEQGAGGTILAERGEAYRKVSAILARDVPNLPLCETPVANVAAKQVQGRWAWTTGYTYWEDVWMTD